MRTDSGSHYRNPQRGLDYQLLIEHLRVGVAGQNPVQDISVKVKPGSIHCLVGDSGSGKTLTSLAAIGLLPTGAQASGSIRLASTDQSLLEVDDKQWSSIRGSSIGYVGQHAIGCLHPAFRIETQIIEAIRTHRNLSRPEARKLVVAALGSVDLPNPERVARSYPAQLSGGMCQRVALAIALCNDPPLLIADEPTTALDNETQSHIVQLIRDKVKHHNLSVLLITHDQDVVADIADEVTTVADGISTQPKQASVATAVNRPANGGDPNDAKLPAMLELIEVCKTYKQRGWRQKHTSPVLDRVTISASAKTTIGLVGRSGAGKTTLARIVAGILPPTTGTVRIAGRTITKSSAAESAVAESAVTGNAVTGNAVTGNAVTGNAVTGNADAEPTITGPDKVNRLEKAELVQYVFQDAFGSLNPRRSALCQAAEPLVAAGRATAEAKDEARELLAKIGLTAAQIDRSPRSLSGGQCQRVGIARALIRRPFVVVLDEPVSALDWSIRSEILAILKEQQESTGALYLLISHDRALIERESDRAFSVSGGAVQQI